MARAPCARPKSLPLMSARPQRRFAPLLAWLLTLGLVLSTVRASAAPRNNRPRKRPPRSRPPARPSRSTPLGRTSGRYDLTLLLANERLAIPLRNRRYPRQHRPRQQLAIQMVSSWNSARARASPKARSTTSAARNRPHGAAGAVLAAASHHRRQTPLHQQLIAMFNGTFKTAGVRQIYFSEIASHASDGRPGDTRTRAPSAIFACPASILILHDEKMESKRFA